MNGTASSLNVSSGGTNTTCLNGATSWGAFIDSTNRIITFTSPTSAAAYVWVAAGTPITINISSNATFQGQGTHWITNTTSAATKSINIGGSFGGTGVIEVAIIQSVQLSATIAETLTLAITGLPGLHANGGDKMAGCVHIGPPTNDDEDGITINAVTTTAAAVPFGTLAVATFYEGCQRLEIQTNAAVATRLLHGRTTHGKLWEGLSSTTQYATVALCTPTTASTFSGNTTGLGIGCVDSATSASCSTANPNWVVGTRWTPISAESKGLSPAK